jgi:uncharacterized protein
MINLLIDADGCPVVDLAIKIALEYEINTILFVDTAHYIEREQVKTITVPKGPDAVDFKIVNTMKKGDIVVTNDYGLAAMCIAKQGYILTANGRELHGENIDQLLTFRYEAAKFRKNGGRLKGPKKRTVENDLKFEKNLRRICEKALRNDFIRIN